MHGKIVREQLDPYEKWKTEQVERQAAKTAGKEKEANDDNHIIKKL